MSNAGSAEALDRTLLAELRQEFRAAGREFPSFHVAVWKGDYGWRSDGRRPAYPVTKDWVHTHTPPAKFRNLRDDDYFQGKGVEVRFVHANTAGVRGAAEHRLRTLAADACRLLGLDSQDTDNPSVAWLMHLADRPVPFDASAEKMTAVPLPHVEAGHEVWTEADGGGDGSVLPGWWVVWLERPFYASERAVEEYLRRPGGDGVPKYSAPTDPGIGASRNPRIVLDPERRAVRLDGKEIAADVPENAYHFLRLLVENPRGLSWKAMTDIHPFADTNYERVKNEMPPALERLIERGQGRLPRLKLS